MSMSVMSNVCVCLCVSIPESAAELRSLAMKLPVHHSLTRQQNWQLSKRTQGDKDRGCVLFSSSRHALSRMYSIFVD